MTLRQNRLGLPSARRGFTLMELIVVISLIVILIGLAVPTFRLLSGNRSTENAGNVIGAMLARARADAVGLQEVRGVALFRDPITSRMAAATVQERKILDWVAGTTTTPQEHVENDYVRSGSNFYICIDTHTDTGGTPLTDTTKWRPLSLTVAQYNAAISDAAIFVELLPDRDIQFLPKGVDVRGATSWPLVSPTYRYVNPAVFLFDSRGSLISREYRIVEQGSLALKTDWGSSSSYVSPPIPYYASPNPIACRSSIGFVMFDAEAYANASFSSQAEADSWLDEKASPVLINRYNGTLVKGD